MGREVIALEAEGADPNLGREIHNREGVENRAAVAAAEWSIG